MKYKDEEKRKCEEILLWIYKPYVMELNIFIKNEQHYSKLQKIVLEKTSLQRRSHLKLRASTKEHTVIDKFGNIYKRIKLLIQVFLLNIFNSLNT